MRIYFVRHTSVDVPQGITYGQTDVPVNSTFETEAEQVKEQLTGLALLSGPVHSAAVSVWPPTVAIPMPIGMID